MIKTKNIINGKISTKPKIVGKIGVNTLKVYPELEDLEVTPSATEQNFKSEKYGYDNVKVKAVETEEITITPKSEEQIKEGVFSKVTVKGIETEEVTITPSKEEQVKNGLFNKVTVLGDENLIPENIAQNKTIFGVEGTAKSLDLKITDGRYLFYYGARTDYIQEFLSLCENIKNASYMFYSCSDLTKLDVSNLDTSNVTSMSSMFSSCSTLTELDLSNFNTSKVTDMSSMFFGCRSLTELDLSNFNTSKVTNMASMFTSCSDLTELDVSNFNTSNVTSMSGMFSTCSGLTELDLSNFDMSKITNNGTIFYNSTNLININSFKNLGKGYTQKSANYSNYKLDLSKNTKLTHDSLVDIITNGLYDLNLTYDVANGGTLYAQSLVLGGTNYNKLSEEEIAIATSKGWNVTK